MVQHLGLKQVLLVFSPSLISAILAWKLSISENIALYSFALKHPKTTPLSKFDLCTSAAAKCWVFLDLTRFLIHPF